MNLSYLYNYLYHRVPNPYEPFMIYYFLMLVERFAWFDQHEIITHEMFVGGARFALRQQTIS